MSGHVAPHRWADAWAGKLDDAERAAMDRHADACPKCARTRARVTRASDSFVTIRSQTPPELSWDSVRARVHWSVSTARRTKLRGATPPIVGWTIAGAAAIAGALAIATPTPATPDEQVAILVPKLELRVPVAAPVQASALVGLVNRATGDVLVNGIRPDDLFTRRMAAGDTIVTGDGRVDVQFGEQSGFALGPRSRLVLRKFDSAVVELVLDGTIDVEVAPRASAQRFAVLAGERTIEVRGTQFRVRYDTAITQIDCRHGLVALSDAHGRREVGSARRIALAPHAAVADAQVVPLSTDELAVLVSATPMTLPLWAPETLTHISKPLEIATAGRREVRVDGVELGQAPLRVRVMPGRHTVEAADGAGRFQRAGWVDVTTHPARLEVQAETPPTRGLAERRRQLLAGLDRRRLAACTRAIAKQGVTTFVQIEITVDAAGNKNALNIIDTELQEATTQCIHDTINDVAFGPGAAATWRERIDL